MYLSGQKEDFPRQLRACISPRSSEFFSVAEVAAVTESRYDVFVFVHAWVDGCAPKCDVGSHVLLEHVHAFGGADDRGDVHLVGLTRLEQGFVGGHHASARGQHGIDDDECLALDARRSHVFGVDAHFGVFAVGVHAEGGDKGVFGMVEDVEETFVERQTGTQYGGQQEVVLDDGHLGCPQGGGDGLCFVGECARDFVGHGFAYATDVLPEQGSVALVGFVANLGHELVDDGVLLAEVDGVHGGLSVENVMSIEQRYEFKLKIESRGLKFER